MWVLFNQNWWNQWLKLWQQIQSCSYLLITLYSLLTHLHQVTSPYYFLHTHTTTISLYMYLPVFYQSQTDTNVKHCILRQGCVTCLTFQKGKYTSFDPYISWFSKQCFSFLSLCSTIESFPLFFSHLKGSESDRQTDWAFDQFSWRCSVHWVWKI